MAVVLKTVGLVMLVLVPGGLVLLVGLPGRAAAVHNLQAEQREVGPARVVRALAALHPRDIWREARAVL